MSVAVVGRSLRLSIGMLTALRVPAVLTVSPGVATGAMLLAPVAVLPLGVLVGAIVWAGGRLELPALAVAFTALAALAVGSQIGRAHV